MVASLVPVAASAVSFGALHIVLKRGRCFKALQRVFQKRKEAGDISPNASTKKLASQAEARIVNEVHNVIVVRPAVSHASSGRRDAQQVQQRTV